MGTSQDLVFQDLRKRISDENPGAKKRRYFSKETKRDIEKLATEGCAQNILSQRLGISDSTLSKWRRQYESAVPRPKRLKIVKDFLEPTEREQTTPRADKIDMQLPNGILLKNLILDSKTLDLLRGC